MADDRINCIAVDSGKESERAFDWYIKHFHKNNDTALLVHVQETPKQSIESLVEGKGQRYTSIYKSFKKSEKVLDKYKSRCVLENIKFTPYLAQKQGSVGQTICNVAEAQNASVIVTGKRNLDKISKTLLGTKSNFIAQNSQIPILIVPFNKEK
ncbi:uncharacterized protein LOC100205254 [Hydra vulgaris]|uniref:uncharacterized protein LOC100205254 n=1 Tax=Hydra vulgaris TaxID=6087 RepID=UPI0001925267|nr:uncharacterized protein LOC100205254 [Hydra vulgaris]